MFFRDLSTHGVPSRFGECRNEGRKATEEDAVAAETQRWCLGIVALQREMCLKAEPGLEGDEDTKVERKALTAFVRLTRLVLIYLSLYVLSSLTQKSHKSLFY